MSGGIFPIGMESYHIEMELLTGWYTLQDFCTHVDKDSIGRDELHLFVF